MKLYHGTNKQFTQALSNSSDFIDVSKGRGELGQGFYLHDRIGLVKMWAFSKFNTQSSVIEFEIDDFEYSDLNIHIIKKAEIVIEIYKTDQRKLFDCDVVEGPFMNIESRIQYKFESRKGEVLLNKSITRIK